MTSPQLKETVEELGKTFEAFKAANDKLIEDKAKDIAHAAIKETVERMNKTIGDLQARITDATKAAEEAQLMAKRRREVEVQEQGETPHGKKIIDLHRAQFYKGVDFEQKAKITEAFNAFLKGGKLSLSPDQKHAMSSYSDPSGGYVITPEIDSEITFALNETSAMRQIATIKTVGTDQYERRQRVDLAGASWRATEISPVNTTTPTFQNIIIRVHDLDAMPQLPVNTVNDAFIDLPGEISRSVAEEFSIAENTAFVNGTGMGQPQGFLQYPSGTTWGNIEQKTSGSAGVIVADDIHTLVGSIRAGYRANAVFCMNRNTLTALRKLKDTTNQYIWQPSYQQGQPQTLAGYPLWEFADMPDIATGAFSVAFGDFKRGYFIVDRMGAVLLVDPYTNKGFINYFTTKRVGGGVNDFYAIKLLKIQ